jgi:hypothetical protein
VVHAHAAQADGGQVNIGVAQFSVFHVVKVPNWGETKCDFRFIFVGENTFMEDYIISVGKVEEWQMTNDLAALDVVFDRAKRVLVGGGIVALVREQRSGEVYRFEEFSTPEDFEVYKIRVYKNLGG